MTMMVAASFARSCKTTKDPLVPSSIERENIFNRWAAYGGAKEEDINRVQFVKGRKKREEEEEEWLPVFRLLENVFLEGRKRKILLVEILDLCINLSLGGGRRPKPKSDAACLLGGPPPKKAVATG